jgi:hypothetical protein
VVLLGAVKQCAVLEKTLQKERYVIMATPVLGPETRAKNKNNNVNLTRIEKERLERLKKLNPEVPKERTLMEKLVDQLRKSSKLDAKRSIADRLKMAPN